MQEVPMKSNNIQSESRQNQSEATQHQEGPVARSIERETAKLPSDAFLWAAFASMGAALMFQVSRKKDVSLFVGQWAAPFLILGVYNKLVKLAGSDCTS
jgi:hypothetical protein